MNKVMVREKNFAKDKREKNYEVRRKMKENIDTILNNKYND